MRGKPKNQKFCLSDLQSVPATACVVECQWKPSKNADRGRRRAGVTQAGQNSSETGELCKFCCNWSGTHWR